MPTARRPVDPGVIRRLLREPYRFRFFQTVRLLERFFARRGGHDRAALGRRIRFANTLRLAFPASEIEALEAWRSNSTEADAGDTASPPDIDAITGVTVTPALIGMLGAAGVLPYGYTERLADRELYRRDRAARSFMDIFTNRAVALFYSAWKKYRPAFQYELEGERRFLPLIAAFAGFEASGARARLASGAGGIPERALAFRAGLIGQRPLSAAGLAQLLRGYFQIALRLQQFVGSWYHIPGEQRSRLGARAVWVGRNAVLGSRVWQRGLRLRLVIGPLSRSRYQDFLPGGAAAQALARWLSLLGGDAFEYQICLVLRAEDVRPVRLGGDGRERLGWNSFVCTRASLTARTDAMYLMPVVGRDADETTGYL